MNSDLVRQTQPSTPPPSTSAHALKMEERLDALFLACSQQYEHELDTDALFLACSQQFEQELKTEQKLDALLPTWYQQYGYEQAQSLPQRNSSPTHQPFSASSLGQSWILFNDTVVTSFCYTTLSVRALVHAHRAPASQYVVSLLHKLRTKFLQPKLVLFQLKLLQILSTASVFGTSGAAIDLLSME